MQRMLTLLPLVLLCCVCNVASGQSSGCATSISQYTFSCSNSAGCSQTVTSSTPIDGGGYYAEGFECTTVRCCGVGDYPFCYFSGGECYYTKLDDPAIRKGLLELAQTQDVMVVSCKGNYRPLMAMLRDNSVPLRPVYRLPGIGSGQ